MSLIRFLYYIGTTTRDAFVGNFLLDLVKYGLMFLLGISPLVVIFRGNIIDWLSSKPVSSEPKSDTRISIIDDVQNKPPTPVNGQPGTLGKDGAGNKGKAFRVRVNGQRQPKTHPPVSKPRPPVNGQMLNEIKETREGVKSVHQDYKRMLEEIQERNRKIKEASIRAEQLIKKSQGQ